MGDFYNWTCPLPLRNYPAIVMGHGGGGQLTADLIEHLFLPAFGPGTRELGDAALVRAPGRRLAFSTDSYVVRPLVFPGGDIGQLAVNGTINDLAMMGAQPIALSTGFILEEGLPMTLLATIAHAMGVAARIAGVPLATGDTKVVDRGHGDGMYINTSGIGSVPDDVLIGPTRARPSDVVIVSGDIGAHGMAIMSVREGLTFDGQLESDTAPLNGLVHSMLRESNNIHVLRDPTRGGVGSSLNEIAKASQVGILIDENSVPMQEPVRAACEMLGMDPLYVANEGKLIAIVASEDAERVLACMHRHRYGTRAAIIGRVTDQHAGMVAARTALGTTRMVPMQIGEQLPRIC